MRIGIDARMYGPRIGGGGIGRYVASLVNHLQEVDSDNEYVIFLRKENFHDFIVKKGNFTKRLVDVPWYSWHEQRQMPKEIVLSKVQLMHYPHWNVPIWCRVPFVVTIHDLILLEDEKAAKATTRHPFIHGVKMAAFRHILEHAVLKSRHIVTVSSATKRSITNHFRIQPQKVSVVYNGLTPPEAGKGIDLATLGVRDAYVLYVGNAYTHKNLEVLIDALKTVDTQLVIAGKFDKFSEKLKAYAEERGVAHKIRFLHAPTDAEIGALYRGAALFVFPSRIEGFGFPPLEAMSCGTPVAASDIPALREVLKDAPQYVRPDDVAGWAAVMRHALDKPEAWKEMVKTGEKVAAHYSWKDAAQKTKDIYLVHGLPRL